MKYIYEQINNTNINEYSTETTTRITGGLATSSKEQKEYYVIKMPDDYQKIIRFDILIEPWIINPQPKDLKKLSTYWEIDETGIFKGYCSFFLVDNLNNENEIILPSENHRYSVVDYLYTDKKRDIKNQNFECYIKQMLLPVGPLFTIDFIRAVTN